jgi:hypothetical protein
VSSAISRLEQATRHHWPTSSNTRLEVSCVLFAWERELHPDKVHEVRRRTLQFRMFPTVPQEGNIQLDEAGGKSVYL